MMPWRSWTIPAQVITWLMLGAPCARGQEATPGADDSGPHPIVTDEGPGLTPAPELERLPSPGDGDAESETRLPAGAVPGPGHSARAPWWQPDVVRPLGLAPHDQPLTLEEAILTALRQSPQIRVISDRPLIRETSLVEARAEFDVRAFMESKFNRTSDPVGNTLTTGGPPRLRDERWNYSAGLRKKTPLGGKFEVAQRIGTETSNSRFFSPVDQGNSRLILSFNQPLMNGAGRLYNQSLILLAGIEIDAAWDRSSAELQTQLLELADAYWQLHLHRATLVQTSQHLARGRLVLEEVQAREQVDSTRAQILRAQAAVAIREADLIRARAQIRNVEARLRVLMGVGSGSAVPHVELVPVDLPAQVAVDVDLRDAVATAVQHRPEIDEAMQQVRAAGVRFKMSKKELLPALDLVLETYVSGLDGDFDIGQSLSNQFTEGEPGYTAGLVFEVPLHNRAARARYERRRLELRQLTNQFQQTIATLSTEVELAVRESQTTLRELDARQRAMLASAAETSYLHERWKLLAGDDRSASFALEDLLDAQDRLAREEREFAASQQAYTISLTSLKRAMGTLLEQHQIEPVRELIGDEPSVLFEKRQAAPRAE